MNRRRFIVLSSSACALAGCRTAVPSPSSAAATRSPFQGWSDAIRVSNGVADVVVVPSVGRVMQFGFTGGAGVFWENPVLAGRAMPDNPWETAMGSFGGDKTWPAPQSAWNWPPPDVFDRTPLAARIERDGAVVLVSPVSVRFGIRTERHISLHPHAPVMRIRTTYQKVEGPPVECAVWVITQLRDPVRVFLPIPKDSAFPAGWSEQWKTPVSQVMVRDGMVSIRRESKGTAKIGNDGGSLLWIGAGEALRIDVKRDPRGTYPDEGCSVEVYTNGDPVPYVELETLAPMHRLSVGQSASSTNVYRLYHRQHEEVWAEARALMTAV